jgi:hypothetical protein
MTEVQPLDVVKVMEEFQDFLAPKLDCYEQAIYLYLFRHSRLHNKAEVVIGFKSARKRMALGVGQNGTPMSEGTCYKKLRSLERKGYLYISGSEREGTRVKIKLPSEIDGIVRTSSREPPPNLEDMDFFTVPENRQAILQREGSRCFYCLREPNDANYVIEHVVSRPIGDNGYRNVVAACRSCNNQKDDLEAEDFLRSLYRRGMLSTEEFEGRRAALNQLREGGLKPVRTEKPG